MNGLTKEGSNLFLLGEIDWEKSPIYMEFGLSHGYVERRLIPGRFKNVTKEGIYLCMGSVELHPNDAIIGLYVESLSVVTRTDHGFEKIIRLDDVTKLPVLVGDGPIKVKVAESFPERWIKL